MAWLAARAAPIAPLLARLDLSSASPSWGVRLRAGLLTISERDLETIARAMGAALPAAVRAA
ncbi:hypothetical protein WME87_00880 [Sorangium sp. So ce1389]